jgi:hypothetical protein
MIKFLDLFSNLKDSIKDYKVHLATTGENNPLTAFLQNNFKEWQESQSKRNFERNYIVSLIYYDKDEWLFAGIYKSISSELIKERYIYETELLDINTELIGRLIIKYEKSYRQSYPYLENCIDDFYISQILKEKYSIAEFPGYEHINIDFDILQTIVKNNDLSWYTALKNIKGVYIITDKSNGKHYVGSVYGIDAFWSRWTQYAENGHGGNKDLKKLIAENGINYSKKFQFSILEIRATTTADNEIIERENYWKDILLTREYGYNKN